MAFLVGGANSAAAADTGLTNSLRFNDGDSPNLNRTFGTNTSNTIKTFSCWLKRSTLGAYQSITSTTVSGNIEGRIEITSGDQLQIADRNATDGTSDILLLTTAVFRDVSAWYHIVVAFDTTQGTDTNRVKIYVNGTLQAISGNTTYPPQNYEIMGFRSSVANYIGVNVSSAYFGGYMADVYFIDGTQYAASDFGETDEDSGIWKPKDAKDDLTFGTNGFYLEFKETGTNQDSSGMGADTSGEDNHLAVTNLAATDQCTDTPANNFCTINSIFTDAGNNTIAADYSEGNTKMLTTVDAWKFGRGTFLLTSGKWYAEVKATETGNGEGGNFGIVPSQGGVHLGYTDDNDVFEGSRITLSGSSTDLEKVDTGSATTIFDDFASGSTAHLAIDLDNNKLWVGHSGTWYNDDNASATLDASNEDIGLPSVTEGWVFMIGQSRNGSDNITWEYNWGNPPNAISSGNADANGYGNFEFEVPSGFYAVCTKNLAEYG